MDKVNSPKRRKSFAVKIHQACPCKFKFRFDVESFHLKFELKFGNSNKSTNFPLKLQNSSLGVSAYLIMSGT